MSEEPAAKRMKSADEFSNLRSDAAGPPKAKLMELDAVQHQLDVMSEKAAEEILKVEQTFNKKRLPIYEKRKKVISGIPNFWQMAFLNHHLLSTAIPEEQEDLLGALLEVEVQEFEDIRSGFKIVMTFGKNDYFENETITKSYHLQSESPSTEITEIEWKENKKPAVKSEDGDTAITFLEWLTYEAPPDSDEIAEVIKDDLYINPLQYYVMPDIEVEENDIDDFLNAERGVDENGQPIRRNEPPASNEVSMAEPESTVNVAGNESGENVEEEDEDEAEGEEEEEGDDDADGEEEDEEEQEEEEEVAQELKTEPKTEVKEE